MRNIHRILSGRQDSCPPGLLNILYPVPSAAEAVLVDRLWDRRAHVDLGGMSLDDLTQEQTRVRMRLALEDAREPRSDSVDWLKERRQRIEVEMGRRGRSTQVAANAYPISKAGALRAVEV